MTEKQKYAIKLAIDTMDKYISRYWNTSYGSRKTGVAVGYGEAISILSDMLSNADNHTCNCQNNSSSRDNGPCCRCGSRKAKINKAKVDSLEIITRMLGNKPYYELKYRQVGKNDYSIGYSSYDLKIVLGYIDEYFEIVKNNKQTNADMIRNMSDEELAEFIHKMEVTCFTDIIGYANKDCGQGKISCRECRAKAPTILEWLQSEAE